jgi:hypothetical protein
MQTRRRVALATLIHQEQRYPVETLEQLISACVTQCRTAAGRETIGAEDEQDRLSG